MNLYVDIQGGLGLNISFTRAAKILKEKYENIYVKSPYWDVFQCCPDITGTYKPEESRDFLFDAISSDDNVLKVGRLYDMQDFIAKKLNYDKAWLKFCDYDRENIGPGPSKLDFNLKNIEQTWPGLRKQADEALAKLGDYESFIIVQFWGGQSPLDAPQDGNWLNKPYNYQNEPLKRHYPVEKAQEFVNQYKDIHPHTKIIQYSLPNEPMLEGCEHFTMPYLAYALLAQDVHCRGFVAIDSSLQHLISGLVDGVVIWGHSLPENFGYENNTNVIQKCRRDDIMYFTALGPSGARVDYINPNDLYNIVEEKIG